MLWWTLPIFLIVAVSVDKLMSKLYPLLTNMGYTKEEKLHLILLGTTVMPIFEELAFRWFPLSNFGLWGMIIATALWILFHGKPKIIPFYTIMGAYFCYLWYIDMGWLAILIHVLWNILNCIGLIWKEPELAKWRFKDPSITSVLGLGFKREGQVYRAWVLKIKSFIKRDRDKDV